MATPPHHMEPHHMQQAAAAYYLAQQHAAAAHPPLDGATAPHHADPAMAQAYASMFHAFHTMGQGFPPMGMPGMPGPYSAPFGAPPAPQEPTVSVHVDGMKFQYQLTEDDIQKVFSRYGNVKRITVDDTGNSASITFHHQKDAQQAMQDLNGKVLNGLEGTLRLQWVTPPEAMPPPYPGMPFPGFGFPPFAAPPQPAASAADKAAASAKGARKYTCRFLIGIENDQDFQVARRIIGAKGANMKRIVRATEAKLRLRGQGSGYFEGAGHKESSEPLQLCISCTSAEGYRTAVNNVEELLKRVYEEYKQWCRDSGKPAPDLQINLSENQLLYSGTDDDEKSRRRARAQKPKGTDFDRGEPGPNAPTVDEIEKCIDERNEARRACNFAEADRIRDTLHARGVALMDEPGGRGKGAEVTTWRYWRD